MTDILDPKHPKWGEYLEPTAAPSAPAQEPEWADDLTCPNCVTPWKCNGPHIPQEIKPAPAAAPAQEPVAWLSTVVTEKGSKLQRLGFTQEEAEMANAIPVPLYEAKPAPAAAPDGGICADLPKERNTGEQEHEAAAHCPLEGIASSEATCLNTEPSARIGSDTQQGKLDADAGSTPASPTQTCRNCGENVSDHYLANFSDGPHIGANFGICPRSTFQPKPAPAAAPDQSAAMPTHLRDFLSMVCAEVDRATAKFPTWPTDPLHALAVLGEEFGELTKAMLQHTYEPHKATAQDVREEAIQTAAMALRLLMSLSRYEYRRGEQHEQR